MPPPRSYSAIERPDEAASSRDAYETIGELDDAPAHKPPPTICSALWLTSIFAGLAIFAVSFNSRVVEAIASGVRIDEPAAGPVARTTQEQLIADDDDDGWFVKTIDLREHDAVKHFLRGEGINETTDEDTLLDFLPKLVVRLRADRVRGVIGAQAATGYVTFCLLGNGAESIGWESQRRTAGYLVVMSLEGEVVAVRPTDSVSTTNRTDNDDAFSPDDNAEEWGISNKVFYNALKMRDPHRVLLGANYGGDNGNGPVQMWDWVNDELHTLGGADMGLGTYTSHDLQWVSAQDYDRHLSAHLGDDDGAATDGDANGFNGTRDRIWRPSDSLNALYAVDAASGRTVRYMTFDQRTFDMNHFQVLEGGVAIVNGRVTGSFRKIDLATGRTLWVCGGRYGNFTIIDLDGKAWEPGWKSPHPKFLFDGQHNLEYFGNGEYLMFDNAYNENNVSYIEASSRPMRLQLDEDALVANITWAFETGVHSTVYGDADLLPTGHVLACYWPQQLSATMRTQFDARVVEIVPARGRGSADEVAWELLVHGHRCTEPPPTGCARSDASEPIGWSMYSVERFYLSPVVHQVHIMRGAVVGHGEPTTRLCRGRVADATESAAASEVASAAATDDDDSTNGTLSLEFVAFDSFKRNFPSDGAWRLEAESSDDDAKPVVAARGTFTFKPHWRPSTVRALLSASLSEKTIKAGSWRLVVEDQWAYHSRQIPLQCGH